MSSEYKIKSHSLEPNHLFMDIHKNKVHHKIDDEDAFTKYKLYERKIELLFSDLPEEHKFWLMNGKPLKGLRELYSVLDTIPDEVYSHHVNIHKNDFSEWIRDVYHDEKLALQLLHAKNKIEAKKAIEKRADHIIETEGTHKDSKSLFRAIISKLDSQNKKLEEELRTKRDWLEKKQDELKNWELKNVENEKKLYNKYESLDRKEKELLQKFKALESQGELLKKELQKERIEMEKDRDKIHEDSLRVIEERKKLFKERENIQMAHEGLKKKEEHNKISQRLEIIRKNEPVYSRLDELMSYVAACVYNKNYKEARDTMSKVKYYYATLAEDDPKKGEFHRKIIGLKKHLNDTMSM